MKTAKTTKIGIIGCGDILPNYLRGLKQFPELVVIGIADNKPEVAQARAIEFNVTAMSTQQLLDSAANIIVNLTPPDAHFAVCMQIIQANKHVYTEKPLAANFSDGKKLMEAALQKNLRVACAPDTFLGAAGQTARELIDHETIGRIMTGRASMMERGPDDSHPNPDFFYKAGAGPLFDMGVYYLTQLIQLLGPITSVQGMTHTSWNPRIVMRGERAGSSINVETPTHIVAGLHFLNGAFISMTTSFDVWKHQSQHIELFGENGSLVLPDPNNFGGKIYSSVQDGDWQEHALTKPFSVNVRGLGVADLAEAIHLGSEHRASGEMALHVLEIMELILEAAESGTKKNTTTTCVRPTPLQRLN